MNEKVFVGWVPNLISLMPDHVLPAPLELLPNLTTRKLAYSDEISFVTNSVKNGHKVV